MSSPATRRERVQEKSAIARGALANTSRRVRPPRKFRYAQWPWRNFTNIKGKAILAANGFKIPRGRAASNADEAVGAAKELGSEVVVKIQAWTTGRAGIGGVALAKQPEDVRAHAERMLAMKVGRVPVEAVLVEEKIDIDREFFLSFAIDDGARAPMIIFAAGGGSGIEERAAATRRIPCDVNRGPLDSAVDEAVASCGL